MWSTAKFCCALLLTQKVNNDFRLQDLRRWLHQRTVHDHLARVRLMICSSLACVSESTAATHHWVSVLALGLRKLALVFVGLLNWRLARNTLCWDKLGKVFLRGGCWGACLDVRIRVYHSIVVNCLQWCIQLALADKVDFSSCSPSCCTLFILFLVEIHWSSRPAARLMLGYLYFLLTCYSWIYLLFLIQLRGCPTHKVAVISA